MAGRGPAPKRPQDRARQNKDGAEWRVITMSPEAQPSLEDVLGFVNPVTGDAWTDASRTFWSQLGGHPTTRALLPAQWSSLARAVAYDEAAMAGVKGVSASEARLRLAKFGIDPDDLLRLRVQVVAADEAERRGSAPSPAPSSRERRGPLTSAG